MSQHLRRSCLASAVIGGLLVTSLGAAWAQDAGTATAAQPTAATLPPGGGEGTAAQTGADTATAPAASIAAQTQAPSGVAETSPATTDAVNTPTAPVIPAAYLIGDDRTPTDEINQFLLTPRAFLDEAPVVAERVSARAARLVGSDERTVPPMIAVAAAPETPTDQRAMIAVGLAQATRNAEPVAPEYAAYVQESVARSGSEPLIAAYSVAFQTTEIQTASLGAGGAAAGGSPSGGTLSGGGDSGISGAIGGDDVVAQTSPASSGRSGSSVSYSDNGGGGSDSVDIIICQDPSPTDPRCPVTQ